MVMGCYGIGVGRTVAAITEQNNDERGIIWPMSVSPFQVIIIPVNVNDKSLSDAAETLYGALRKRGLEVLLDDRDERAGVKFNDADLIGIPLRITLGPKKLAEGEAEVMVRKTGKTKSMKLEKIPAYLSGMVRRGLRKHT